MQYGARQRQVPRTVSTVSRFGGLNETPTCEDGEWLSMSNMTTDRYPRAATRAYRLYGWPIRHGVDEDEAVEDAECLTYNGESILYIAREGQAVYPVVDGLPYMTEQLTDTEHKVVCYAGYFVVFPEGWYINTVDKLEFGFIDAEYSISRIFYSDIDGLPLEPDYITGAVEEPLRESDKGPDWDGYQEGAIWLRVRRTIGDAEVFRFDGEIWEPRECLIALEEEAGDKLVREGDTIRINFTQPLTGVYGLNDRVTVRNVVDTEGGKLLVVRGWIIRDAEGGLSVEVQPEAGTVTKTVWLPEIDFCVEHDGRLWACRYGLQRGETVNEIFCTAARSFSQWEVYDVDEDGVPLDTDSVGLSVSSAGAFTGAAIYNDVPTFFKEERMYRVSGSSASGFSLYTDTVPGVREGCEKSLCVAGGVLYWMARMGVYAYNGGRPTRISTKLDGVIRTDCMAAGNGRKAVFVWRELDQQQMYIYDAEFGTWTREELKYPVRDITTIGEMIVVKEEGEISYGWWTMADQREEGLSRDGFELIGVEKQFYWHCETGLRGLTSTRTKYVSRVDLRLELETDATAMVSVEYDSSGVWERLALIGRAGLRTQDIGCRLRRCDHYRLRIEGAGQAQIVTLAETTEGGSERHG